jgi:GNAT superfamily N-acetyltransferase
MKFNIRYVDIRKPEICTAIIHLQKQCLPFDRVYKPDHGHWWIVYTETGAPVGFAGLRRSYQWGDAGYLCRAGVLAQYQGHGLQKRLIDVRIRKAKSLNWAWLLTDTTDNPASANSLIAKGFRLYEPALPWAYKNSLYWRLDISRTKQKRTFCQKKRAKAK